jgi:DNA-binding SARP family transcriptional activator/class 3 adenylate cyclase
MPKGDLQSGTVTFLFTDIEGSTRLLKQLRERYGEVLADQRRIVRDALTHHGGEEVDTQGDAFFYVFRRARSAAEAATDAQKALSAHEWPEAVQVRVRMGLHTAEPTAWEEGYHGLGVHRGARIMAVGHGGQILLSQATASVLSDDELDGITVRDLGEHQLKDMDRPERIHQLVVEGLSNEFPPLRTGEAPAKGDGMEFSLLGPLEVRSAGATVHLGGPKQRALLALLLIDAGRTMSTDRLIDALWGERPPRTAQTSLQNFVSQLRKVLGPEVLVTKPPGYLLRVDPLQVDVNRAQALLSGARAAEPDERAAKLREALDLWRGPPLDEFAFEAFAENEIARLEELRLTLLEERIDADIETGRAGEVVGELETLVDEHPLRERLREHLMLALYRAGRQAEALEAFSEGRRVLVEELGIDPSPRLQQLHGAILRHEVGLEPTRAVPAQDHFEDVVETILQGRVIPVLGADVADLTVRLAQHFGYPDDGGGATLPRVAQYVAVMKGSGPLYDELHELLNADLPPTSIHRFLATLPPLLRERGLPHQLLVTTSYDTALERAFEEAGEAFEIVSYLAAGRNRGRFCHIAVDGTGSLIEEPNTYATELSLERNTVILKLHGQVERTAVREWESFVVTEDDYIDYLAQADVAAAVPVSLAATLRRSHFLFLGYTMADWNLRVVLHRLWGDQPLSYRSWAVQPEAKPLEREFWRRRDVDVVELAFEEYADTLGRFVAAGT